MCLCIYRYFDKVTGAILGTDPVLRQAALECVQRDEGLHQLLPYFCRFIAVQVTVHILELNKLLPLLKLTHMILTSRNLHVEPYLHQLMPPILSCLVARRLCANPTEDHWSVRDYAATLVARVCQTYGDAYVSLQPRIIKTLTLCLLDPKRPFTAHYGAIVCLAGLGRHVVESVLLRNLKLYMTLLRPILAHESSIRRLEAQNCYGALLDAAGGYIRQEAKEAARESTSLLGGGLNSGDAPVSALVQEVTAVFGEALYPYLQADQRQAGQTQPAAVASVSSVVNSFV